MKKLILLLAAFMSMTAVEAKVTLPPLLADDMVLQRDSNVKIWGKTDKGTPVNVIPSWSGTTYTASPDAEGNWSVEVRTTGAGGPYSIKISDGEETVLRNIMLGDVWICSGQSNMEMNMRGFTGQPVENALNFILESEKFTDIRMFTMKMVAATTPQEDIPGKWAQASVENTPRFSATAWFFAKTLNEALGIPIGIIHTSWGGSTVETWMSRSNIEKYPHFKPEDIKENPKVPYQTPTMLYNAMIYPLRHLTAKGFAWYQGESNIKNYQQYPALFADMVKEWRGLFQHMEDAPFYFVQISPFSYGDSRKTHSAYLREAQTECLEVPHTGMAVTMDIGEEFIIHPPKKEIVGQRLAYQALAKTYNKPIPCDGPVLKEAKAEEGKMLLEFDHADGGLCPIRTNLEGFEIAGENGKFVPAQARVKFGKRMEVWSDKVKQPKYVRYGFRNYTKGTLYNAYHLPAASFRTDDFAPEK